MATNSNESFQQFERANSIQEINAADEIYAYDSVAQQTILQARPWLQK